LTVGGVCVIESTRLYEMKYQRISVGVLALFLVAGELPPRKEPQPAIIEEHLHQEPYEYQPTKPTITVVATSTSNNGVGHGDAQLDTPDLTPVRFHSIIR
jgi:hypothetical protein